MSDEEVVIATGKSKEQKDAEREEKRKKVGRKYYSIPEDELQKMIARAQSGNQRDQEELLKVFSNFLEKYVKLLSAGRYDLRDYDTKQFIYLYIGDAKLKASLRPDRVSLKTYKAVDHIIQGIKFMVCRYNNEDDVRQTINMTFLKVVSIYKYMPPVPFSGYLYRNFFYRLKKVVDELLIDENGLHSFPLVTDDSVGSSFESPDPSSIHETAVSFAPEMEDLLSIIGIDEYWVLGESASYPFNLLTVHERQLLKWRYVDGLRPNKIAEKTSDHPNTCRQHIKAITNKLKDLLEEH